MDDTHDEHPELPRESPPPSGTPPTAAETHTSPPVPPPAARPPHSWRKWVLLAGVVVGLTAVGFWLVPTVGLMLNTVSTDDAYVNGHVTFVAPRVAGEVARVLVDDNMRVKKGALLVQLDKEPYRIQVEVKKAAVLSAERDVAAAEAQVRGMAAQTRAYRYRLQHAMEDVNNQVANLRANVATLKSKQASLALARANLKRAQALEPSGGISKEELDQRRQGVAVAEAAVEQAREIIYASRVSLGLPARPAGGDLAEAPADLDQNFSTVREALADLLRSAAQLGYFPTTWDATPKKAQEDFYKQDARGNLDRIYAQLIRAAPPVKQAEAKLLQARRDLEQAELNLRYCDVVSEIDGQVTRRNVNPGNYVQMGQNLMAVRSLTEIWIDANFKETQLGNLRIGQRARIEVDMYGSHREYEGRITGFSMGTGQTLALLPPQNATGNFVKIVQRLPVRIELTDYDPEKAPLFAGLSVTPYVYFKEAATGPHAGTFLQPLSPTPAARPYSTPAGPEHVP